MTTALNGVPRINGEYQGYVNGLTNGHSKSSTHHVNGHIHPILDGRSVHQNEDFTNEMVKGKGSLSGPVDSSRGAMLHIYNVADRCG